MEIRRSYHPLKVVIGSDLGYRSSLSVEFYRLLHVMLADLSNVLSGVVPIRMRVTSRQKLVLVAKMSIVQDLLKLLRPLLCFNVLHAYRWAAAFAVLLIRFTF